MDQQISKAYSQKDGCRLCYSDESFLHQINRSVLSELIDGILHQRIGNDAQREDAENQIDNSAAGGGHAFVSASLIEFLALLVVPIEPIDTAGNERQQERNARGCAFCLARDDLSLVMQLNKPIDTVDTAGDDGENDT